MIALVLACTTVPPKPPTGFHPVSIDALKSELSGVQQNPRIYNFWATWCGPCMREIPEVRAYAAAHPDVDVVFVNVDVPSLHGTKVAATIDRMDMTRFRNVALASKDPAVDLHGIDGWPDSVPVTFVVRPDGSKAKQFNVAIDASTLDKAVAGL